MSEKPQRTLGQVGFDEYGEQGRSPGPWQTFDGRAMPRWGELTTDQGQETVRRWEAAAEAIVKEYCARSGVRYVGPGDDPITLPLGTVTRTGELGPALIGELLVGKPIAEALVEQLEEDPTLRARFVALFAGLVRVSANAEPSDPPPPPKPT